MLETAADPARVALACQAAAEALPAWRARSLDDRSQVLGRLAAALSERREGMAEAIRLEVGKLASEARVEAGSLAGRIAAVGEQVRSDLADRALGPDAAERLVHRPHGVVGVIGPYNFPLHLCHAHVAPALLLGNTVVVKPSEIAPLAAQRYAEAAEAAGLPPGVLNLVQGGAASGAALAADPRVMALCVTGSWATGRRLLESEARQPERLLALELGGKNAAIVLDDADLRQAAHEIVLGACLTTGQRCTATDTVLVERGVAEALVAQLVALLERVRFGDPQQPDSFAGPLATRAARERFLAALSAARAAGAEPRFSGLVASGGFYVSASLHLLPSLDAPGYGDVELFGPDLALVPIDDEAAALAALPPGQALVHSIFSARRERFERLAAGLRVGIVNWNRGTNRASPRLPFGGTGRSGNFRPAGSHAPRNLVVPVAVQEQLPGVFEPHPALAAGLAPPDLDALERRHEAEEQRDAERDADPPPRPLGLRRPAGGALPESEAWLRRLYAGERVPREKKPPVVDHRASQGPWLVSVDASPLSVLDGMSQTATLPAGFAPDPVVEAYARGEFGGLLRDARDTTPEAEQAAAALRAALRRVAPGFPQIAFVNSGAEAVEKALELCRIAAPGPADRVLAFEGGFHGRTLLALHATWSPAKRLPFELPGYEACFAPFPVWDRPGTEQRGAAQSSAAPRSAAQRSAGQPAASHRLLELIERRDFAAARRDAARRRDPLLLEELRSLAIADAALASGRCFACLIEPMQSEGGDRHATPRFFQALRRLTRRHGVPLVMDEVQTGFGLSGSFLWHTRFELRDARGHPDRPDAVCLAKKAQLGVVLSRFEDPEPAPVHPASLVRGRLHLEIAAQPQAAARVEADVGERLAALQRRHPELVRAPRVCGFAFAFELPDAGRLAAFLAQRFWRGAVVFAAGERTARYRLSPAFGPDEVASLFEAIHRSLALLEARPGLAPPAWEDPPPPPARRPAPEWRLRAPEPAEAQALLDALLEIEARSYEPARRDSRQRLALGFEPEGIAVVCEVREAGAWRLAGSALGTPLERVAQVAGPDRDPSLGQGDTLYSLAVTVDPRWQGLGIGLALKQAQRREAARRSRPDGVPRYRFLSGRNRVGAADAMARVNRRMGAFEVFRLAGQYGEPDAEAAYYRIPVGPFAPDPPAASGAEPLDLASGLAAPVACAPGLERAERLGALYGPAVHKLTLCNYATPASVRAVEWIASLVPELPHLYLANSRDEALEKTLRALRLARPGARVAVGFEGGYLGHTTAAARSLSDPALLRGGRPHFAWPRVPHPARDPQATLEALEIAAARAGGPERLLAVVVEAVQERTGRVVPEAFWSQLGAWLDTRDVPLVLSETASAAWRSGRGALLGPSLPRRPDALVWWAGGQVACVHVGERYYVAKPLTLVSTWDGDELSLVRLHHQLRAARRLDVAAGAAALEAALAPIGPVTGLGLYRVIEAGERAPALAAHLLRNGLRVGELPAGRLAFAPPLDTAAAAAAALAPALAAWGSGT